MPLPPHGWTLTYLVGDCESARGAAPGIIARSMCGCLWHNFGGRLWFQGHHDCCTLHLDAEIDNEIPEFCQ